MDRSFRLPYFVPKSQLPAPLPEPEAIEGSRDVLQEQSGRRIVCVNDCYIVKYGLNVSLTEGLNMLFARETDTAAVPEVFALYSRSDSDGQNIKYIVMQNVIGDRLDNIWARLSPSEKNEISDRLRVFVDALRQLPSPGFFGYLGRKPFEESMFWTAPEDGVEDGLISGPFESESQFNNALVQKYLYNSGLDQKALYYRRVLPLVLRGNRPVFTHGDLQRKNIIITPNGIAVLIDWETSGWYPEYWEYAMAMFACGAWEDDWHEYVGKALKEYPNEYAWFDMLRRELWS